MMINIQVTDPRGGNAYESGDVILTGRAAGGRRVRITLGAGDETDVTDVHRRRGPEAAAEVAAGIVRRSLAGDAKPGIPELPDYPADGDGYPSPVDLALMGVKAAIRAAGVGDPSPNGRALRVALVNLDDVRRGTRVGNRTPEVAELLGGEADALAKPDGGDHLKAALESIMAAAEDLAHGPAVESLRIAAKLIDEVRTGKPAPDGGGDPVHMAA